jgi:hypothetical protein
MEMGPIISVGKSAYSMARKKINPMAYQYLAHVVRTWFYQQRLEPALLWFGMRLLAVDGSSCKLPQSKAIKEHFSQREKQSKRPLARISQLFDVLNYLSVDLQLGSYHTSENTLLRRHYPLLQENDLLLFDRGYPSYDFFLEMQQKKVQFCGRVSATFCNDIKDFVNSTARDQIVKIKPKRHSKYNTPILLRMIRVELITGPEYLITTLLDSEVFPTAIFKELYALRWSIEESFKVIKCKIALEDFTGLSVESVYQDVQATFLKKMFADLYAHPLRIAVKKIEIENPKYKKQLNFSLLLSKLKTFWIKLFFHPNPAVIFSKIYESLMNYLNHIEKGRSFERNMDKHGKPLFNQANRQI